MRLQVGGIIHDAFRPWSFTYKTGEDKVKYPESAPPVKAVIEGLVGAVEFGSIPPLQTIADDVDDAAHHAPVIDTRHAVSQQKMGEIRAIWALLSTNSSLIRASSFRNLESNCQLIRNRFNMS